MTIPYLRALSWATVAVFFAVAVLIAIAFPMHASDALTFGEWSRLIASHWHHVSDPSTRPLFYVLQGSLWHLFGYGDTSGRLLCGLFSALLVVSLAWLMRAEAGGRIATPLVALFVLATPVFAYQVVSSLTDVVVAALIALVAALVFCLPWRGFSPALAVGIAAALAVLAKPSAIAALIGLAAAVLAAADRPWRSLLFHRLLPVGLGMLVGFAYYVVQASRTHTSLHTYLAAGVTSPYYSSIADATRRSATLDFGWLGSPLRTLLLYSLAYTALRLPGARHRTAVFISVPTAAVLAWFAPWVGAREARLAVGAFANPSSAAAWAVTTAALVAGIWAPEHVVPTRRRLLQFVLFMVLPLVLWIRYATYDARLLTPAWPGLFALLALCSAPPVAALAARRWQFALVPAVAAVVAVALNIYNLDGLGRAQWSEWLRTPAAKSFDHATTRAIVLPDLTKALTVAQPVMQSEGRMLSPEGAFRFFFPGRVDQAYATSCAQLSPYRVFVLTLDAGTRDYMEHFLHVSADPSFWGSCTRPRTRFLPSGAVGYAVFAVGS